MSNISRVQTIFNNIADREVPPTTALDFLNAVVDERNLEPDPDNPQTNEIRAGLFLAWFKRVLKQHRADAAAAEKRKEALAIYEATLISAAADLS